MNRSAAPDSSELPSEGEVQRWYDGRYAEVGSDTMRPADAYDCFLNALDVTAGGSLLDVACGAGHLLHAAQRRGLDTTGVDLSSEAIRLARDISPESTLSSGSAVPLEFADDAFDFVTCLGSLEHFPDPDAALAEMKRVAKPGARLCIVVPNADFLVWKWLSFGTEQQQVIEKPRLLEEWTELIGRTGLEIVRIEKEKWYLKRPRFLTAGRLLPSLERAGLWLLWRLLPLRSTYQFQFILVKSGARNRGEAAAGV